MSSLTKWNIVIRGTVTESWSAFAARVRVEVERRLATLAVDEMTLTVTDLERPRFTLLSFQAAPAAILSLRARRATAERALDHLEGLATEIAAYAVDENVVVGPPDGEMGPVMFALVNRRRAVTAPQFESRWRDDHMPLAASIHPYTGYVCDVVRTPLRAGAHPPDGIAFEACGSAPALLNPLRFYGGALRALPNMVRVVLSLVRFLDISGARIYFGTMHTLR